MSEDKRVSNVRLPVIQNPTSGGDSHRTGEGSLGRDGHHKRPYPADVQGKWLRRRRIVYALLIALWAALPWIPIGGHPAVFLDIERRQFFLFGMTANAQDVWLVFFALTGVAFGLVYATAFLGRVWCGWACPQTVFLESLFRPLERAINGPRNVALRRAQAGWTFDRAWRAFATHAAYLVAAGLVAHVFLAYFVSLPRMFDMMRHSPGQHPEAFAWALGFTALFYVNFGMFREQFCVVMCPYGRLQSVLLDDDSLIIGYDDKRGEPRGKSHKGAKPEGVGDCVDCSRCVVVCPTAIDIREGLQLDCIACTACIDACDDVMDRLERPRGLIRYDSQRGLRGEVRRILRPRIYLYTVLLLCGVVATALAFRKHEPFEASILRLAGMPYTRDGQTIRNTFELQLVNKQGDPATFTIEPAESASLSFILPMQTVEIESLGSRRVPVFVTMDQLKFTSDTPFAIRIRAISAHGKVAEHEARAVFLGAKQ
jgi:cytochrome c oxidase accessory protein FixG